MTDELNDFGFCFVDEDELEAPKLELETIKETSSAEIESIKTNAFDTLQSMQSLILPLLLNLKKNPEKDIIKWPNRGDIIQAQIDKIEQLVDEYQTQIS
jgi:hypothetical protein